MQQRRSLFPGIGLETTPTFLNFQQSGSNLNSMFQAKQELRDNSNTTSLEISETEEGSLGRKRRPEQDLSSSQQHQMGSYLLQTSSAGAIPASHGQVPANFWMLTNSNNQAMSGDPIWTFPSVNNSALYRSTMSSGLHFMNFPTHPMALLPGQQLGSTSVTSGGGNGGSSGISSDQGHLNMLAGLNPYHRQLSGGTGVSESQASGSHSHHDGGGGGGNDRHDTTSHHS